MIMAEKSQLRRNAAIRGSIQSREPVVVEGAGTGDIESSEGVLLVSGADWQGEIRASSVEIQNGARFEGAIVIEAKKVRWLDRFWS